MTQSQEQTQLSNKEYWSSKYPIEALPQPVDPRNRSLRNFFRRYHHKEFSRWLKRLDIKPGAKLIEIGGGGSIWLPYFGAEHGLDVTALDYSRPGAQPRNIPSSAAASKAMWFARISLHRLRS
jgi:hypothetical protein